MNDNVYWTEFYKTHEIIECSDFCNFVTNYIQNYNIKTILDAGCGTGRDSYALSEKYTVTGVDLSCKPENKNNCKFIISDFCSYNKEDFDLVYSRFTFHSITNDQHEEFLRSINRDGVLLCIECRSDKDQHTEKVHGTSHYRNYINSVYLQELLKKYQFDIEYIVESDGLALYKGEDPVCLRVICRKNYGR